jgi:beta-lactamase regulating signal transducer with metallopeptidase domain
MPPWTDWLAWGADRLAAGSLQGAGIAAVVWAVCRYARSMSPSTRAFLWWLVSLKLALSLAPLPSVAVPILPAASVELPIVTAAALDEPDAPSTTPSWLVAAMALWLAGVSWHAVRLALAARRLRHAVRRSTPIGGDDAAAVDRLAGALGLGAPPDVRMSTDVEMPLVTGLVWPTVLLPSSAVEILTPAERAMAICHELAHVRRRDLLLGWVPAVAERLFFFHPLARIAAREYAVEREAACDALVLRATDASAGDYGHVLVRLGVASPAPSLSAGGSSPSASVLKRRLAMLNDVTFARARRSTLALLILGAAFTLVPFDLTAQAPRTAAAQSAEAIERAKVARMLAERQAEVRWMEASLQEAQRGMRTLAETTRLQQRAQESAKANARLLAERAAVEEQVRAVEGRKRAVDEQKRAVEEQKLDEQLKQAVFQMTTRTLREQLRVLAAQQERTVRTMRELSLQLEQIRQQLERTDREVTIPPGSARPF